MDPATDLVQVAQAIRAVGPGIMAAGPVVLVQVAQATGLVQAIKAVDPATDMVQVAQVMDLVRVAQA